MGSRNQSKSRIKHKNTQSARHNNGNEKSDSYNKDLGKTPTVVTNTIFPSKSGEPDDKNISLLTDQIKDLRAEYISIQSSFLTMTSISFCGYGLILYYAFNLDKDLNGEINGVFLCLRFYLELVF